VGVLMNIWHSQSFSLGVFGFDDSQLVGNCKSDKMPTVRIRTVASRWI
jgi:hypothetical protein